MVLTFFDEDGKKFRQIEGTGNAKALLKSKTGDTHNITTLQEQDMNNTPPILIVIDEEYPIDVEIKGKIELPPIEDNEFKIKVIEYTEGVSIEFEHVESLEVTN